MYVTYIHMYVYVYMYTYIIYICINILTYKNTRKLAKLNAIYLA